MYGPLRFLAYFLILVIVVLVVVKQSSSPRCQQCRKRIGKRGVKRTVYGEDQMICLECNDRMSANEGVPDFNRMKH